MYLGRIVEIGPADVVCSNPIHPYTLSLLNAVPVPDPRANAKRVKIILEGDVPSAAEPPNNELFQARFPGAKEAGADIDSPLIDHGGGHLAACLRPAKR
jgi:oligopeptide/dipeptide ABC transporter ATP-binding protein